MKIFNHATGIGCALLLSVGTTTVAMAAEGDNIEEVVVTGIRHGIEDAIEIKKDSGSIVEAISAEDIGKLPDTSIADSISRLPGLTSQRAEGRASAISLRGTDPGFTTALLNGREQVSTGDNRSIEFEQYPSELLSSVVIYKTPDAGLIGQGLAGTIDLRTTRPLNYGRRTMAFNLRGEANSHDDLGADADEKGYRASFSYIDQFADDTIGLTFGVARLVSPLATRGAGTYEPWHANGTPGAGDNNPTGVVNPGVGPGVFVTDGIKVRTDMGENRRDGAMAALQWRPSENFNSILDVYYTRRKQDDNARSLEVNLGGYPAPCCDGAFPANTQFGYANPVIRDNTVVAADLLQRVPLARNFLFKTQDRILALGWNNEWLAGDWTYTLDVSHSKAKRNEQQYETNAQIAPLTGALPPNTPRNIYDTGTFAINNDGMPRLHFNRDYADPATVQVGPTIYGAGYSKIPRITDELTSGRIDFAYQLNRFWMSDVVFGVNYADREKDKLQPEGGLNTIGGGYFQIAPEHLESPTNLSYAGANSTLAWDVPAVLRAYYQPIVYGTPTTPGFDYLIGKNWNVTEKVTTAFVRGSLDHELSSSVSLRGNVGLQLVKSDQESRSVEKIQNVVVPLEDGKDYDDVLPAINLAFMLPSDQAVRVGIARELARARMDQLKASSEIGYDSATGLPGGSSGTPLLDPWRANAFDLSYEKYLGSGAYFSAAAFYKDLKTYIYNETNLSHDFSDLLASLPPGFFPDDEVIPALTGKFTRPVNGKGGNLKGIELATSLTGDLISDALGGFGVILSYAHTESSITIVDPPNTGTAPGNNLGTIPLPGLSEDVWSATLYYENAGFSARVGTRARSKYIGEVTNFANDRAFKYVKGDQITDAQIGYEFGPGRLQGLSLLFQVNNLTDEPYVAYAVTETRQQDFQEYGRQFLIGVNYKL
jgi:iron complex outermembrane receptor protein